MNTTPIKRICFDRETKDYAIFINGVLLQYAPTYLQAEQIANDHVYELLRRPNTCLADVTPEEAADILQAQQDVAQAEELALEAAAGVDYFDRIDAPAEAPMMDVGAPTVHSPLVPSAPRPIYVNTPMEVAFAITCIRRRKAEERKQSGRAA